MRGEASFNAEAKLGRALLNALGPGGEDVVAGGRVGRHGVGQEGEESESGDELHFDNLGGSLKQSWEVCIGQVVFV